MTIYAMKLDSEGIWAPKVHQSLTQGRGRFGWSYTQDDNNNPIGDGDLWRIKSQIDAQGWHSLNRHDSDRMQWFLLGFQDGDWVVYINTPSYGECTLAKVISGYFWDDKTTDTDFNHSFAVDPASVHTFRRDDGKVSNALRRRLSLQGKFWRVSVKDDFEALVSSLEKGEAARPRTPEDELARCRKSIEPSLLHITQRIQHHHPGYDLEVLLELVFKAISGTKVTRQGGAGDHGADLIVELETGPAHPVLQTQLKIVVQAKSYVGEHWDTRAVEDIERAFVRHPDANMGLIVSTADGSTAKLDEAIAALRDKSGKRVELLIGSDVARFIMQFGAGLI